MLQSVLGPLVCLPTAWLSDGWSCNGTASPLPAAALDFRNYCWDSSRKRKPPSNTWTHLGWRGDCAVLALKAALAPQSHTAAILGVAGGTGTAFHPIMSSCTHHEYMYPFYAIGLFPPPPLSMEKKFLPCNQSLEPKKLRATDLNYFSVLQPSPIHLSSQDAIMPTGVHCNLLGWRKSHGE